jgi:hypothetical protein
MARPLHQLYNDFKQAFDSIGRFEIKGVMKEFGIPAKVISLTVSRILNKDKIVKKI